MATEGMGQRSAELLRPARVELPKIQWGQSQHDGGGAM
jgi:hypothetical protein